MKYMNPPRHPMSNVLTQGLGLEEDKHEVHESPKPSYV